MIKHQVGLNTVLLLLLLMTVPASAAVLASIRPLAFIAAAIAEGVTTVEALLPDGASPHHYTLRPSDLRRLQAAELVVWIGPDMEIFLAKPLQTIRRQQQLVLSQEATITPLLSTPPLRVDSQALDKHHVSSQQLSAAGAASQCCASRDLHLWLSPAVAKRVARLIYARLLVAWPQQAVHLLANLTAFEQQLGHVEQAIHQQLAPLRQRGYFVFHDAYRYFELYFGLQQRGHFTLNPMTQPGVQRLHQIHRQLQQPGVICVFTEPQFKPAVIEMVVRGTQAKIGTLDPLGMQLPVTKDSYPRFLRQLAQQFADCLQD